MKKIQFLLFFGVVALFSACDKHDNLDDSLMVGRMAPQVYWEFASTSVNAGENVAFKAQYYTADKKATMSHLEVWYNVTEYIEASVTCAWLTPAWSKVTNKGDLKRQFQLISKYPHSKSYWNPEKKAYTFESSFPTSVTLSTFEWKEPESFDDADLKKVKALFGETFPEDFQKEVFGRMKEADFNKMFVALGIKDSNGVPIDNFRDRYSEYYRNEVTGMDEWGFTENPVGSGKRPVPEEVRDLYFAVPFDELILNSDIYGIVYKRSYSINAYLKAIDTAGNSGRTAIKTSEPNISLN